MPELPSRVVVLGLARSGDAVLPLGDLMLRYENSIDVSLHIGVAYPIDPPNGESRTTAKYAAPIRYTSAFIEI